MDSSPSLLVFPQNPEDRLRLALRRLDSALAEQSQAVAEFRANLAALKSATASLSDQLHGYHRALGDTAQKVRQAHAAARQLEQTADKMAALG